MNGKRDREASESEQETDAVGEKPVVITKRDLELLLDRDTLTIDERRMKRRKN